jgi:regulator of cell morphogenesis and NO signaling
MNILEELRRDHDRLRVEMADFEVGLATRERLGRFVRELLTHASLEDELLFGELENSLSGDHGPLAVMREEHEQIEGSLARLGGADPADEEVRGELARMTSLARDHFRKEEEVLFAFAERLIDGARLSALGAVFREGRGQQDARHVGPEVRIADLAREQPATIRVFQQHGVDFCCGGKRSLAEACEKHGISYELLAGDLSATLADVTAETPERWAERTVIDIVGHILARFHSGLRDELARLEAMAARARDRHGESALELHEIAQLVTDLRREMVPHLELEEREIFPALMRGETGSVADLLREAENEHEGVGRMLARLRELTDGFRPPVEACNTWRGLYHGLSELERDTHLHVHLENNVLFHRLTVEARAV